MILAWLCCFNTTAANTYPAKPGYSHCDVISVANTHIAQKRTLHSIVNCYRTIMESNSDSSYKPMCYTKWPDLI